MTVAIKIENLSKQYRLGLVSARTLSHDLNRWWQTNILGKDNQIILECRSQIADFRFVRDWRWCILAFSMLLVYGLEYYFDVCRKTQNEQRNKKICNLKSRICNLQYLNAFHSKWQLPLRSKIYQSNTASVSSPQEPCRMIWTAGGKRISLAKTTKLV